MLCPINANYIYYHRVATYSLYYYVHSSFLLPVGICTNFSGDGISSFPEDEVRMWVFEEILPTGKKLSESINEQNVRVQAR